jgi:hypothetical protein
VLLSCHLPQVTPNCDSHVCSVPADNQVAARLLELLDIICYRLDNSSGLLYSTYTPAVGNATWRRAEDAVINYGALS